MSTRQYLMQLIRFQPWLFYPHCVIMILFFVVPLLPGLVIREIFNLVTNNAQVGWNQWTLLALLVVASLAHIVILFGSEAVDVALRVTTSTLVQKNLLQGILARPGATALSLSPGEAVSRFRDDVFTVQHTLSQLVGFIGIAALLLTAFGIMVAINPFVALVAIIPLLIVVNVINRVSMYIEAFHGASQETTGHITGFIGEIFGAILMVKATTSEENVLHRFEALNERRQSTAIKSQMLSAFLKSVLANMSNIGMGLMLLIVGQAMRAGDFTVGDLALFMLYLNWLTESTGFLGLFLVSIRQSKVSFERLNDVLVDAAPDRLVRHSPLYLWQKNLPDLAEIEDKAARNAVARNAVARNALNELRIKGLTYHYPDTDFKIQDIDFTIEPKTLTVLTGRIGSGKTSLLRLILGLLPKDGGDMYWNGQKVADPASFFTPPHSAYVPQVPTLFSGTIRDNILLGMGGNQVKLSQSLQMAVLEETIQNMELGLDTLIGPKGMRLSGGQMQRTSAARAFVREPELYIFDDLSSALDVETEGVLWQRIFAHSEATFLVVSHRPAVLRQAKQVIVLKEGRIEGIGSLETLLKDCEEMQRLWSSFKTSDQ